MARRAPLEGIRVADFTWVWAGPFCTLQLAHLGAEVIRVETATRLCVTRLLPPYPDMQAGTKRSGYFNQYNHGKKSITLDLKRPEAVEVARRLCAASDVVAENFAAGVMDRAGLGYETLRQRRPDLIMVALSGYGATGPDSDKVSYGPAQVPLSGMSSVTGYRGFPPMHVGISYGDPTGGLHGPVAVPATLQAAGIAAFTAATNRDIAEDPHLRARGFFVELPHPEVGTRQHIGIPWRMSASDCRVRRPAPCLGADTDAVLREVCGYTAAEIDTLRAAPALA